MAMIDRAWSHSDYMNLTKLDRGKQAHMQGATMESVYWFHEGWKIYEIYTWNKDTFLHGKK